MAAMSRTGTARHDAPTQTRCVVLFQIGAARCAIDVIDVVEIRRVPTITRLPRAASVVEGVVNARGRVIPVIDFGAQCGVKMSAPETSKRLIVAQTSGLTPGLIVDRVTQSLNMEFSPLSDECDHPAIRFSSGFAGEGEGEAVALIDPALILHPEEAAVAAV